MIPEDKKKEIDGNELIGVPIILCPEDHEAMVIEGIEVKEVEDRKFFLIPSTEDRPHLKYRCPRCGRYFLLDLERRIEILAPILAEFS